VWIAPRRGDIAGVLVETNGLPMSGTSYIGATLPVAVPPSREAVASSAPSPAVGAPKPAVPAATPAPTTITPLPPSFPVTLQFDQQTQRVLIEAKDSTGLVVFQVPFKSAGASPGAAPSSQPRGQTINSKA
jgi:hypothetical protein